MPRYEKTVMCRDGIEVPWEHSTLAGTTLASDELTALLNPEVDWAEKFVAHARLTRAQCAALYNVTKPIRDLGFRRFNTGRRILASNIDLTYCSGIGSDKLIKIFNQPELRANRRALLKTLLACT